MGPGSIRGAQPAAAQRWLTVHGTLAPLPAGAAQPQRAGARQGVRGPWPPGPLLVETQGFLTCSAMRCTPGLQLAIGSPAQGEAAVRQPEARCLAARPFGATEAFDFPVQAIPGSNRSFSSGRARAASLPSCLAALQFASGRSGFTAAECSERRLQLLPRNEAPRQPACPGQHECRSNNERITLQGSDGCCQGDMLAGASKNQRRTGSSCTANCVNAAPCSSRTRSGPSARRHWRRQRCTSRIRHRCPQARPAELGGMTRPVPPVQRRPRLSRP